MTAREKLDQFLNWRDKYRPSIKVARVYVRRETLRRQLHIPKGDEIVYRDTVIKCLGSPPWRNKNPGVQA